MKNVGFNRLVKVLQIALAILLLTSVLLIVTACECSHEYTEEITIPATCTSAGEVTYTCNKCGEFYSETIPALDGHKLSSQYLSDSDGHWQKCEKCDHVTVKTDHAYVYLKQDNLHWQQCETCGFATDKVCHEFTIQGAIEESTCATQGSNTKACACGAIHTDTLPLASHSFNAYQKEGNLHWQECDNCDATTEKTEHKFNVQGAIVPSTCSKQGSNTKTCVCGESHTEELPLAQHSYTKTAYNDDKHWVVCINCDNEDTNQARTPHDLVTETTYADCENGGRSVTTCTDCDYEKTDILKKLEHDLDKTTFSSSSNGSGHYYKCNRCGKNVTEPHDLKDVTCPNNYNRVATCYQTGHQDRQCTVCNWRNHFSTPMTSEHNFSSELEHNGTVHWYPCTNGDGACDAHGSEAAHTWSNEVVNQPTCTENGSRHYECECGEKQTGSNKNLNKLGHDYITVEVIKAATCDHENGNGLELRRCTRCDDEIEAVTERLKCVMEGYSATAEGHSLKCINCGYVQTTNVRNHTWLEETKKEATCTQSGLSIFTCKVCGFTYDKVTTKNHSYVTVPDSSVAATCEKYATHDEICTVCGDTRTVEDKYIQYAPHKVKEYQAKEMTETEAGNRHYWQCTVCGKYFTGSGCAEELTEDQVFVYPPKLYLVESITELFAIAATMDTDVVSNDYYQITATVQDIDAEYGLLMIGDADNEMFVTLVKRENAASLDENNKIILKGNLLKTSKEVTLVNCKIISVDCGVEGFYSLFFTVTVDSPYIEVHVDAYDESFNLYDANTNNYNCLAKDEKLIFYYYDYGENNAVLQKVIVNGKAYTATGGVFEITVTEDIHIEFIFDHNNYCSITLRELDTTNNNGDAIVVDEYISYTYTNGGYNEDGRLHKNSYLTFTVNNANITGVNITYDADSLAEFPNQFNNVINAIKASGGKVEYDQSDYKNEKTQKIVISFSASDGYTALEYFANASQARIAEITVLYQTNNTFVT